MSKKITYSNLGISIGIKNSKKRFKEFSDGLPVFEIIEIGKIEEISIVENPAFGQYLVLEEIIDDGKDETIEIHQPKIIDITQYIIESKKFTLEEQKQFELKYKDKIISSYEDKYGSVLSVDGYKFYIYGNDHLEKAKNIDFRIDFEGNYLSTVKGCNGMNKNIKKIIKNIFTKFLNDYKNISYGRKTGKEILIDT